MWCLQSNSYWSEHLEPVIDASRGVIVSCKITTKNTCITYKILTENATITSCKFTTKNTCITYKIHKENTTIISCNITCGREIHLRYTNCSAPLHLPSSLQLALSINHATSYHQTVTSQGMEPATNQLLRSSPSPFLRQRFPFPRAKHIHNFKQVGFTKKVRPSPAAEEDNPSPCCQLFRVFVFVQVALLASVQYLSRRNTESFKQTIDSRDREIGCLRDKVAELQLQTKESHARGLER